MLDLSGVKLTDSIMLCGVHNFVVVTSFSEKGKMGGSMAGCSGQGRESMGKEKGPTRWVGPFYLAPPAGLELGKAAGFAND